MLTIYRRHIEPRGDRKGCEHRAEGRAYRRCKCPIWVQGFLGGQKIRESLETRDWDKAATRVHEWEARGSKEETQEEEKPEPTTIVKACEEFLNDARARELKEPTLDKYRLLFRRLQSFAEAEGLRYIMEIDLDAARKFRASWPDRNLAALKKLERFRAFMRFCLDSNWIAENSARKLKNPKVTDPPTMPFTRDEVGKVLAACHVYPDKLNAVRLRALVLLLRYSGLRIRDAVTLERDRVCDGKLFLYTAKTGTAVWCPLPPAVVEALNAIPAGKYFFWTGASNPKSCVGDWQRSLRRLFKLAGVPTGHAHRYRDTFAVELLLSGVPLERVSVLLGHQSVKVTEKHYAPWVRARQEQLEADVRRTWETDEISGSELERRVHVGYTGNAVKPN